MNIFEPEQEATQQPASRTLDAIFEAVEDAGSIAAKLIITSRHDEQTIALLHELIGDLCAARLGTQLLRQRESAGEEDFNSLGNHR